MDYAVKKEKNLLKSCPRKENELSNSFNTNYKLINSSSANSNMIGNSALLMSMNTNSASVHGQNEYRTAMQFKGYDLKRGTIQRLDNECKSMLVLYHSMLMKLNFKNEQIIKLKNALNFTDKNPNTLWDSIRKQLSDILTIKSEYEKLPERFNPILFEPGKLHENNRPVYNEIVDTFRTISAYDDEADLKCAGMSVSPVNPGMLRIKEKRLGNSVTLKSAKESGKSDEENNWVKANNAMLKFVYAYRQRKIASYDLCYIICTLNQKIKPAEGEGGIRYTEENFAGQFGLSLDLLIPILSILFDKIARALETLKCYDLPIRQKRAAGLAAFAYRELISIHPFDDGNGRTCRLFTDFILLINKLPPGMPPEQKFAYDPENVFTYYVPTRKEILDNSKKSWKVRYRAIMTSKEEANNDLASILNTNNSQWEILIEKIQKKFKDQAIIDAKEAHTPKDGKEFFNSIDDNIKEMDM